MSYQVLARKWRPAKFSELVGQQHVKSALINGLSNQRLHHAYLFTGTRGVGKTSIARIFAKSLNCEVGVSAEPCGQCAVCQDVDAGRFVDLIEIDAASRTKVGDTREILDNVQYAPTRGRYKIYLIDEVHMLSRHSFNALLKTLEEPPEHVKFLLATTDPQKLPVTILSRCLQFNLQALSKEQISQQLQSILQAEQIPYEDSAITLLAKYAKGSMRDGLSLTDQAIAQSNANVSISVVQQMLGTVDVSWGVNLLVAIFKNDGQKIVELFERLLKQAPDITKVLEDMLELCHQIALTQVLPAAAKLSEDNESFVTQAASQLSPQEIQVYYQLLLQGKKDLPLAPDMQSGFEMLCLRLLAFKPVESFSFEAEQLKKNLNVDIEYQAQPKLVSADKEVSAYTEPVECSSTRSTQSPVAPNEKPTPTDEAISADVTTDKQIDNNELGLPAEMEPDSEPEQQEPTTSVFDADSNTSSGSFSNSETLLHKNDEQVQIPSNGKVSGIENHVTESDQSAAIVDTEYDESSLLAQQAFYQDLAESQGFLGEMDEAPLSAGEYAESQFNLSDADIHGGNNPERSDSAENTQATETLPQKDMYTGTEQDNPVLAILASRGINPEEQPSFAIESDSSEAEATSEVAEEIDSDESEPLPELKPLEHEEVRFAHEVDEWAQLIERSNLAGLGRQLALNGSVEINHNQIVLTVKQEFAHLLNEKSEAELIEVVSQLAPEAEFSINKSEITQFAPSDIQKNINENRQERAERSIHEDPLVQSLLNEFDGKLVPNSITPL